MTLNTSFIIRKSPPGVRLSEKYIVSLKNKELQYYTVLHFKKLFLQTKLSTFSVVVLRLLSFISPSLGFFLLRFWVWVLAAVLSGFCSAQEASWMFSHLVRSFTLTFCSQMSDALTLKNWIRVTEMNCDVPHRFLLLHLSHRGPFILDNRSLNGVMVLHGATMSLETVWVP